MKKDRKIPVQCGGTLFQGLVWYKHGKEFYGACWEVD